MTHAAESVHWYDRKGNPVYEVPDATGKRMITPDIRHARKLGLLPGFSGVERIMAAPGLERYKIRQAVLAALTLTRLPTESDDDFLARVDEDGKAHAIQRATEGTAVHKAIEQFLRGETYDTRWHPQVAAVAKFLHTLGNNFVADFKTRESLEGQKDYQLFFDNHVMQLAAYRRGINRKWITEGPGTAISTFRTETTFAHPLGYGGRVDTHSKDVPGDSLLVSILISVREPGEIRTKIWTEPEAERAFDMFKHCLELWQLKNNYQSGWATNA